MSTFLLGAWMLGCGLMAYLSVEALDIGHALGSPPPAVTNIQEALGAETTTLLLRHVQQEQARRILEFLGTKRNPDRLRAGRVFYSGDAAPSVSRCCSPR